MFEKIERQIDWLDRKLICDVKGMRLLLAVARAADAEGIHIRSKLGQSLTALREHCEPEHDAPFPNDGEW